MPSGLARSSRPPAEIKPAAAACVAAFLTNSLLDISDMDASLWQFFTKRRLHFPSASTFRPDVFLRRISAHFHAGAIPSEFPSRARGDIPKKQSLRNQPREFEISARLHFASLAGVEPFAFVPRRPRQHLLRLLIAGHFRFRNKFGTRPIKSAKNFPAISHKQEPFIPVFALHLERAILFQFLRPRRLQTAVIPREFHRWHLTPRREVVMDDRRQRIRLFVAIRGTGFHTHRRFEFQHPKNCVETVGTHIAESATTEISPPTPYKKRVRAVERAFRRRAEPQIPVQAFGHRLLVLRTLDPLRPERPADPVSDLPYRPDRAVPNPFA